MERAPRVDHQGLAGHGVGAAHRDHLIGAVVFVGGLAQQRRLAPGLDHLRPEVRRRARAFEQAGRHAVDQHLGRQGHRHALGERHHPCLGNGIGHRRAGRAQPRNRGDIDDAAAALSLHHGGNGLGDQHRAGQVDVDDLGPFLVGEVVEILERDRLVVGGIVDQDVEPAEALHHVVDHALHLVALGDVAGEGGGADLVLLEAPRDALPLVLARGVDDGDVTALCSQRMADALAKPAIAAGDHGDCPFQVHAFLPFEVGGSLKPVLMGGNHYDFSTKPAGKPDGGNMGRKYDVIDADGHVLEPFTLWDDYMDPQYRERAPKLVKDENGKERLLLEDKILGSRAGFGGIGGVGARQGVVAADAMDYKDGRKGGFDPHARIPDMDLDGIDAAFLYPSLGLFAGAVSDPAFAAAMCRAYNRRLADYCKPYPDRLFGIAMLPMQSIEAAIQEMRFARKELGFRGGFLRPNPYNDRQLQDPGYEAFWG